MNYLGWNSEIQGNLFYLGWAFGESPAKEGPKGGAGARPLREMAQRQKEEEIVILFASIFMEIVG